MAWSEQQLRAIEARDKDLLVSAAAGSGKTSVLVERIIRRVLQGDFDVDRLLVVTFTKAAAAEMRERIERALYIQLEKTPDNMRLERQLILLSNASISTIDSFCQSILRQNFHAIDLDPKFRLANAQELSILQQETLAALFEQKYEEASPEFLDFVEKFGSEKGDNALYEIVMRLFVYSQSQAFPALWLASLQKPFQLSNTAHLRETGWFAVADAEIGRTLEFCAREYKRLIHLADVLDFDAYLSNLKQEYEAVETLLRIRSEGDWDSLQTAFAGFSFPRMKSAPKGTDDTLKQQFTGPRDAVKKDIQYLQTKYFLVSEEEMLRDLRAVEPDVALLCSLTAEFAAAFAAAKKERVVVDFNDLEHLALAVLRSPQAAPGELLPSAAAEALQEKYQEVMVDEYQDINGIQDAILSLLTKRGKGSLFAVGDVKQSIYRFRLSDPTLFLQKYRQYALWSAEGKSYERIDLSRNFRSRPEILSAINFIFAQVMTPQTMELSYDDLAALHAGPGYAAAEGETLAGPIELMILDKHAEIAAEESGEAPEQERKLFELEAQHIALRLRGLIQAKVQVFDKDAGGYRPICWRDIVILLRATTGKADALLETLHSNDIPAYAEVDSGYFEETEIQVMLSLLSVLDNARQDIPLAAVLYSPIVGLSLAELAELRLLAPDEDLFAALMRSNEPDTSLSVQLRSRIALFLRNLADWRSLAQQLSVPELIWKLYRDTGYYDSVGGMPGGMLRQANLRMLVDRAEAYEKTNFRGLFRFLRFVEKMRGMQNDLSVARTLGESEDVVRVMSIHKSKGLEFPVVVLADCGKSFNLRDSSERFLLHSALGIGPKRVEKDKSITYPTFAHKAIAAQIVQETKAEELRLLYVALTRAREKLILTGSVGNAAASAARWCRYAASSQLQLPEYASLSASSYLDWLCMALARHPDGAPIREAANAAEVLTHLDYDMSSRWQIDILSPSDIACTIEERNAENVLLEKVRQRRPLTGSEKAEEIAAVLNWQYDMQGVENVPAKLSVTELKRRFSEPEDWAASCLPVKETAFRRPQFVQETRGLQGMEYGTVMHSAMQHMNLQGNLSLAGIQQQLDAMVEREILLPQQRQAISAEKVAQFFSSPLGLRMRAAKHVWRELPFSQMLPAHRFYQNVTAPGEQIFSQGIIDVLFEDARGLVLLDYKTDKDTRPEEIRTRYRLQLELYSEAIEHILQRTVQERYLYLLHDGSVIKL